MTPLSLPVTASLPAQPARTAAALPAAPAPLPLAAPAMVSRVEWAGAVRPPDALLRAYRPEHEPRANPDLPTGPPPAFAANLLDHLPDGMERAREAAMTPPNEAGDPARAPTAEAAPDRAPASAPAEGAVPDDAPTTPGDGGVPATAPRPATGSEAAPAGVAGTPAAGAAPVGPAGLAALAVLSTLGDRSPALPGVAESGRWPERAGSLSPGVDLFLDAAGVGAELQTTTMAAPQVRPSISIMSMRASAESLPSLFSMLLGPGSGTFDRSV